MSREPSIELRRGSTTIGVKRDTKKLLDSVGIRGDSYDDIIRRLIREHGRYLALIKESPPFNKVRISSVNTKESVLLLDGEKLHYVFNVPATSSNEDYRMDIFITKTVLASGEAFGPDQKRADSLHRAKSYLRIVEQILQHYFDPLFRIDEKRVWDLSWWERKFNNLGLTSYGTDIEEKLLQYGVFP